jgi:hypothetical protein
MDLANKIFWRKVFFCYVIACYCSRIPSYFIDWQTGPPSGDLPPTIMGIVLTFIVAPILTPLALVLETMLAFMWGPVKFERLLPLLIFTIVAVLCWIILSAKFKKRNVDSV